MTIILRHRVADKKKEDHKEEIMVVARGETRKMEVTSRRLNPPSRQSGVSAAEIWDTTGETS